MAKPKSTGCKYQRIKDDLKTGGIGNCYLFWGEEDYLKSSYFVRLTKKILDGPAADFNHHRFTSENLDWNKVADCVEAIPMMAERSLVEIQDVNIYKEKEENRDKIIEILSNLPDYCCLVFYCGDGNFSQDKRLKKLHTAVEKYVTVLEFERQSQTELRSWLRRHATSGGKDMDNATCDHLAFRTDFSMTAMGSEMQKLIAYVEGDMITKADVNAVVEPTLNAVSFDISNAIADGDYEKALGKLQDLFQMQEEPVLILGAIAAQMRKLYWGKCLLEMGKGADTYQKIMNVRSDYAARLTMNLAGKQKKVFCKKAVRLCLEADRHLKNSYDEHKRLLELLLLEMAQEAQR